MQDLTGRRVEYTYTNGLLTSVKDPALAITTYEYDIFKRLSKVTDSTGKVENITYRKNEPITRLIGVIFALDEPDADGEIASVLDDSGRGKYFEFSYDAISGDRYGLIRTTAGAVDEKWYYADGQLKEWRRNGKLVKREEKTSRVIFEYGDKYLTPSFVIVYFNGIEEVAVTIIVIIPYPDNVWRLLSLDVTDSNGSKWKEDYDKMGNLVKVENPDGSLKTYTYDTDGVFMTTATDENGVVTKFQHDARGNLVRIDEAFGTAAAHSTVNSFDAADRLLTTTLSGDAVTPTATVTNTYDANGDLLSVKNPVNKTELVLSRNGLGSILRRQDANSRVWVSDYDPLNRIKESTDPDTHKTKMEYDSFNNVTAITSPSTRRVDFTYNIDNSLVTTVDVTGKAITNFYDDAKRLVKTIDREGRVTLYGYDELDRIATVTDGAGTQTRYAYDPNTASSDPVTITYPTFSRTVTYNERHQAVKTVDTLPGGKTVTSSFTYSKTGALLTIVDGEGHTTTYDRDEFDRPKSITRDDAGTVYFGYDARGHVVAFTNANSKVWNYTYDAAGQLKTERTPLGKITAFDYDGVGNLITITRPDGSQIKRQFNAKGEVTRIDEYPTGLSPPAKTIIYTRDDDGRVTGYSDGVTTGAYGFDAVGRLASETVNYGTFSATNSYTYYDNGLMKTCTSPAGTVSTYSYDSGNRLLGVQVSGVGEFSVTAYQANAIAGMKLPGGTAMSFTRDGYQRPTTIKSVDPVNRTLLNLNLGYSDLGNVTSRDDGSGNRLLQYDKARRLKQGISSNYTYDLNDNRKTDSAAGGGTWQYDADDKLLSNGQNTYSYNDNGGLISKVGPTRSWAYSYDFEGRLVQVTSGSDVILYTYGPNGRRLSKKVNGVFTYFSYGAYGLSAEFDGNGNLLREYGYSPAGGGGAAPLFVKTPAGVFFYHTDQIGTPLVLADADGNVVWKATYNDFGKAFISVNLVENNLRFPGQYFDAETGLAYNWNRYYDPETGRYITRDAARDGSNHFAYASNNPFAFTDPDGLRFIKGLGEGILGRIIFGGIAALVGPEIALIGGIGLGGYALYEWAQAGFPITAEGLGMLIGGGLNPSSLLRGLGAREGALGATAAADGTLAGSIRGVNPMGGAMNCVNCAIASDATLAGAPASASPGVPTSIGVLEDAFGGSFQPVSGEMEIGSILSQSGNGSRGIVFGESSNGDVGHVFNAINKNGSIQFIDGQIGGNGLSNFNNFTNFRFLLTNPGTP